MGANWLLQIQLVAGESVTQCHDNGIGVTLLKNGNPALGSWYEFDVKEGDTITWQWVGGSDTSLTGLLRTSKNLSGQYSEVLTGTVTTDTPPCNRQGDKYVLADSNVVELKVTNAPTGTVNLVVDYLMIFKTIIVGPWYYDPEVCMQPVDTGTY